MPGEAPARPGALVPDEAALREFWQTYVRPGDVHEVRILHTRPGRAGLAGTAAGYFTQAESFGRVLCHVTGQDAAGVYLTLNPVKPGVLARGFGQDARGRPAQGGGESGECNRLQSRVQTTTSDVDILHRRYLLVDLDPVRDPKDISATDEEMQHALLRRDDVRRYLGEEHGWPEPLVCSWSGNGGALLYRIDLPNDAEAAALVQRVLGALDHQWSDGRVKLDAANYNAARLTKVIGSVAAKGVNFAGYGGEPARPWRVASAVYTAHAEVVARQQLERLAQEAPVGASAQAGAAAAPGMPARTWTIDDLLRANDLQARPDAWAGGGKKYRLDRCLTSEDHADGAALIEMPSGAIVYKCHHDRCADKGWAYLRERGILRAPGQPGGAVTRSNGRVAPAVAAAIAQSGRPELLTAHTALTAPQKRKTPQLHDAALFGLAGDIVRLILPQTEAHAAALLINSLVYFGNLIGSAPHTLVTSKRHGANLFAVLVGRTSGSRKGTSRAEIDALFRRVDADWLAARVQTGLSSGEGLISAVRDAAQRQDAEGNVQVLDEGVIDKRLVVVEEEFCAPIKVMAREGNTLSAVVRQAWDGQDLGTLVRHNPLRASRPHICVLGHATQPELLKYLTDTEMADGFANRFLWVCVERSKLLPHGGEQIEHAALTARLQGAVRFGRSCAARPIKRDRDANALWEKVYPRLAAERPGMFGAVTGRAEAQVLRLSMIYALLECSASIQVPHLEAALALWEYCEESARLIFGQTTGDRVADRILAALAEAGAAGLDMEATRELFGRHASSERRQAALDRLVEAGLATRHAEQTEGRSRTVYRATNREGAQA